MAPIRITDKLHITSQLSAADIPMVAEQGFVAIINNRPDGEDPDQPSREETRAAAAAAGIGYHYLPMTVTTLQASTIEAFRAALDAAPGPVIAHCRSGARSFTLWALGELLSGQSTPEQITALADARGCDPTGALNWLAEHTALSRRP